MVHVGRVVPTGDRQGGLPFGMVVQARPSHLPGCITCQGVAHQCAIRYMVRSWCLCEPCCDRLALSPFCSSHSPPIAPLLQYYEHASSLSYLPNIRTPTLLLLSEDDPFLGVLPDVECAGNPFTLLAATARGGHVAFLQGLMPLGASFMGG